MRWLATPRPTREEKREVRRFAFLPTLVDDETRWVWLEFYTAYQEYTVGGYGDTWRTIARFSEGVPF